MRAAPPRPARPCAGEPSGELKEAIERDFGSLDEFKKQFKAAGATQFGSGWAWLVAEGGKLKVTKTPNAETPLTNPGQTPLLTMDVWEHAYYIDVQARARAQPRAPSRLDLPRSASQWRCPRPLARRGLWERRESATERIKEVRGCMRLLHVWLRVPARPER